MPRPSYIRDLYHKMCDHHIAYKFWKSKKKEDIAQWHITQADKAAARYASISGYWDEERRILNIYEKT